jgi:hypothetical protein
VFGYPSDTFQQAYSRLQQTYIQAAEEHENLRVFWDKEMEKENTKSCGFLNEMARKEFSLNKPDK